MFTYQARQRKFVQEEGKRLIFPGAVEMVFHLGPLHQFGCGEPAGSTFTPGAERKFRPDSHRGRISLISFSGLNPLKVFLQEPGCRIEMNGNKLHIHEQCQSALKLEKRIQGLFFGIPILLNIELFDPPIVEKVFGKVRDVGFEWIFEKIPIPTNITTQGRQENKIKITWERWRFLSTPQNERIFAALHYFHIASRLKATGYSPWEFMGKVILNLCKVLEALFPPTGDGQTRGDAVRKGLENLGYSKTDYERDFLQVMALRDNMDSGHIRLFKISKEQFGILYRYTDGVNNVFKIMLQKLISRIQKGQYTPISYAVSQKRKKEADKVIERIGKSMKQA